MKRYKNPWKNDSLFSWPKDSSSSQSNDKKEEPEKIIKKIEKKEEIPIQIDSQAIAKLITNELLNNPQNKNFNLKNEISKDKLLLFLIFGMGILGFFVIVIAIISLIITIHSSTAINKLANLL